MAIIRQNFLLIQGDAKTYNLYFQDTSGTRLNIPFGTGLTIVTASGAKCIVVYE